MPEIKINWRSDGYAATAKEMTDADKQAVKIQKEIERLNNRAALNEARAGSEEYRAALDRAKESTEKLRGSTEQGSTSIAGMASQFAMGANAAMEIGSKIVAAAQAAWEFAKAGAAAADTARSFERLGDASPSLELLSRATAGVVDDTTLQNYAILADRMGLSAEEAANMAASITVLAVEQGRAADVGDLLERSTKSTSGVMRELGIDSRSLVGSLEGLSEENQKLARAQALSTQATLSQVDAIDSTAVEFASAEVAMANLISDLQIMAAEFFVSSGLIDTLKDVMERMAPIMIRVWEAVVKLAEPIIDLLIPYIEELYTDLAFWLEVALPIVDVLIDIFNWIMKLIKPIKDVTDGIKNFALGLVGLNRTTEYYSGSLERLTSVTDRYAEALRDRREEEEKLQRAQEEAIRNAREEERRLEKQIVLQRELKVEALRSLQVQAEAEDVELSALIIQERATDAMRDRIDADEYHLAVTEQINSAQQKAHDIRETILQVDEKYAKRIAEVSAYQSEQDVRMMRMYQRDKIRLEEQHEATIQEMRDAENLRDVLVEALSDSSDASEEAKKSNDRQKKSVEELNLAQRARLQIEREIQQAHYDHALERERQIWREESMIRDYYFTVGEMTQEYTDRYMEWAEKRKNAAEEEAELYEEIKKKMQERHALSEDENQKVHDAQIARDQAIVGSAQDAAWGIGGAVLQGLVSSNIAQALTETARSVGAFAYGNIPAGIAHAAAATQHGIAEAFARKEAAKLGKGIAGGGSGGGSGGGGGGGVPRSEQGSSRAETSSGGSSEKTVINFMLRGTPMGRAVIEANADDSRKGGMMIDGASVSDNPSWIAP